MKQTFHRTPTFISNLLELYVVVQLLRATRLFLHNVLVCADWSLGFKTSFHSKPTQQAQISQRLITDSKIRVKTRNPIWPRILIVDFIAKFIAQMLERLQASKRIYMCFCATNFEFQVIKLSNQDFSGRKSQFSGQEIRETGYWSFYCQEN